MNKEPNPEHQHESPSVELTCCSPIQELGQCTIDALVHIDQRGQMVLPKEVREKANIQPGDKLAVVTWEKEGKVSVITLIPSTHLTELVKDFLGPMMSGAVTA